MSIRGLRRSALRHALALAVCVTTFGAVAATESPLATPAELDSQASRARERWQASPHGPMLARILPEALQPSQLPQPQSRGARLTATYCVQCHHLPNPSMHEPDRWPVVVERMLPRMHGRGNMGELMREMMRDGAGALRAPSPSQTEEIVEYLRRHAQRRLEPVASGPLADDLRSPQGRMFEAACSQCHALPDPRAHAAHEWPAIVRRMERNMLWMNRVVGSRFDPREPQLRVGDIVDFLQRNAPR